jgi:hypothetical protein
LDIFNKNLIAKLERQLSLKERECISLKSDLEFLERENDELKSRLGENFKVVAAVKSSEPYFIKDAKNVNSADRPTQIINRASETKASDLIFTAAIGGIVNSTLFNSVDSESSE